MFARSTPTPCLTRSSFCVGAGRAGLARPAASGASPSRAAPPAAQLQPVGLSAWGVKRLPRCRGDRSSIPSIGDSIGCRNCRSCCARRTTPRRQLGGRSAIRSLPGREVRRLATAAVKSGPRDSFAFSDASFLLGGVPPGFERRPSALAPEHPMMPFVRRSSRGLRAGRGVCCSNSHRTEVADLQGLSEQPRQRPRSNLLPRPTSFVRLVSRFACHRSQMHRGAPSQ